MSKRFAKMTITLALAGMLLGSAQMCWAAEGKTLQDYITIALQKSPNIRLATLSFERSKLSQTDNLIRASVLSLKQAEVSMNAAKRSFAAAERDLKLSVQTGYYGLLKAQKSLEIATQSAAQAKDQLEVVKVRFQQGMASKLDLIAAEKQAQSSDVSLMRSKNSLAQAKASFQRIVGIDEDVVLSEELATPSIDMSLEEALNLAKTNSVELAGAKESYELAKLQYDLAQNNFTAENQKKLVAISLEEATIALAQKEADVATNASNYYISLVEAVNQIDMANKSMEYAEENYRVMKLRFDAGLEIASSLIQSQMALDSAKIETLNASSDYLVAKTRLMNYVGK